RSNKQMKSINDIIEELPLPEDPMEDIKLNNNCPSSSKSSTMLTYAQIIKQNNNQSISEIQTLPKPQKKYSECLNCGRNTKENGKKSQMTKVRIDEFTLLCEKCTILKENRERYGSSRPIKQCKVCTDSYESQAKGDIVCGSLCNNTLTTINKIYSDGRYNDKISD